MIALFYLIIAFVVFFIMWKRNEDVINTPEKGSYGFYKEPLERWVVWKCVLTSLFWFVVVPFSFFWKLLELIHGKFKKP